jgi:hypothetical protein
MPDKSNYCRLFIMLASEASKAVIFRRGPRIWTEIILWDTRTDTFTEGQWFKGTLYHRRCDLSPDGSKMIYFAAKHYKRYPPNSEYPDTWTAVSRPPYLTTLATAKAHGTWDGGGYFENNNTICINQSRYVPDKNNVPPIVVEGADVSQGVEFKPIAPGGGFYSEEGLYCLLLERRGWQPVVDDSQSNADLDENPARWRKENTNHTHSLLMTFLPHASSQHNIYQFKLKFDQDQKEFDIDSDEWADWDQQGRLVYTHEGKLFAGQMRRDGIAPVQLADFNANKVRLIESPTWAKTWDQSFNEFQTD